MQSALSSDGIRVYKMAITQSAHSGKSQDLIEKFGISSKAIVDKVRALVQ